MSDNKSSNVLEYPKTSEPSRIKNLEIIDGVFCTHKKVHINGPARNLSCQTCGSVLDTFDWLYDEVVKTNNYFREKKSLERSIHLKREQLEMLQAEEKRIKARLANAKRTLGKIEQETPQLDLRNVVALKRGDA